MKQSATLSVTLLEDQWEDIIDYIAYVSLDDKQTEELQAYGILLIESIKDQLYL